MFEQNRLMVNPAPGQVRDLIPQSFVKHLGCDFRILDHCLSNFGNWNQQSSQLNVFFPYRNLNDLDGCRCPKCGTWFKQCSEVAVATKLLDFGHLFASSPKGTSSWPGTNRDSSSSTIQKDLIHDVSRPLERLFVRIWTVWKKDTTNRNELGASFLAALPLAQEAPGIASEPPGFSWPKSYEKW